MKIGRVVLAMAISAGVASADEKKPDVAAARVAAEENAKTPAGKRYETALEASLDRWLKKAVERCVRSADRSELSDFEAFVRIADSGKAEDVVFGAETAVARCVEPDLRDATYPHPPKEGWWVRVEIQLR